MAVLNKRLYHTLCSIESATAIHARQLAYPCTFLYVSAVPDGERVVHASQGSTARREDPRVPGTAVVLLFCSNILPLPEVRQQELFRPAGTTTQCNSSSKWWINCRGTVCGQQGLRLVMSCFLQISGSPSPAATVAAESQLARTAVWNPLCYMFLLLQVHQE